MGRDPWASIICDNPPNWRCLIPTDTFSTLVHCCNRTFEFSGSSSYSFRVSMWDLEGPRTHPLSFKFTCHYLICDNHPNWHNVWYRLTLFRHLSIDVIGLCILSLFSRFDVGFGGPQDTSTFLQIHLSLPHTVLSRCLQSIIKRSIVKYRKRIGLDDVLIQITNLEHALWLWNVFTLVTSRYLSTGLHHLPSGDLLEFVLKCNQWIRNFQWGYCSCKEGLEKHLNMILWYGLLNQGYLATAID